MGLSFKIVVPFWIDDVVSGSTRLRNVVFIHEELKKLVAYLTENGVDISVEIYDFSPVSVYSGATHNSFPLGEFRKSEKWNYIIEKCQADYFIGLDSDMFIHPEDYKSFHSLLQMEDLKQICLFNTRCVQDWDVDQVDWEGHDVANLPKLNLHYYCTIGHTGSFGGLWICPTHVLKKAGGFNENIKFRGDEDGELLTRVLQLENNDWQIHNINLRKISHIVPIHLPHVYHFGNPLYQSKNNHGGEWSPRTTWK
jgi:hypothetical protein